MTSHTVESLITFRDKVAQAFRDKRIRSPVHFPSDTQAEPLISIFKDFREGDWLFSGWRSMWHVLLAGIPEDELFQMILDGRSMFIQDRARRVFCSSIVGGILPIALGVAWSIKKKEDFQSAVICRDSPRVWVFVGDMTKTTGLCNEFERYIDGHGLPVKIIVEDNGLSTNTPTRDVWGTPTAPYWIESYIYSRSHPHVGLTERINF